MDEAQDDEIEEEEDGDPRESGDPDLWLDGDCLFAVEWTGGGVGSGIVIHFHKHRFLKTYSLGTNEGHEEGPFETLLEAVKRFFPDCIEVDGRDLEDLTAEIDSIPADCDHALICGQLFTRYDDTTWVSLDDSGSELAREDEGWVLY